MAPRSRRLGALTLVLAVLWICFITAANPLRHSGYYDSQERVVLPPRAPPQTTEPANDDTAVEETSYKTCHADCVARNKQRPNVVRQTCTADSLNEHCASTYTAERMHDVCHLLCASQHPADCSKARFYVVRDDWAQGYGSDLHYRMANMVNAISAGRVLAFAAKSLWTHDADPIPACAARWNMCYYRPFTPCTLPADWSARALHLESRTNRTLLLEINGTRHQFVSVSAVMNDAVGRALGVTGARPLGPNHTALTKSLNTAFWMPQLAQFMFRPSARFMHDTVAPLVRKTFGGGGGSLPDKYLAVFMRAGDKFREAKLFGAHEFFAAVDTTTRKHGIQHVYVSSDSALNINATVALARDRRPDLLLYYVPYERQPAGLALHDVVRLAPTGPPAPRALTPQHRMYGTPRIRALLDLAITDLYISSHAHAFVGTRTSNWCRLVDELRLANGGYGARYISLD